MLKPKVLLTFVIILFSSTFLGCQKEGPTSSSTEERGTLFLGFSLKAASEAGANITRVNVTISKGTFVDSLYLSISADSAFGTFTNLLIGTYTIVVKVYDGTTLLGTGSGQGTVIANQTTTVRITVDLFSGNLQVIVDWNIPSSVVFEDHFNDTSSLSNWNHTTDYRGGGLFEVIGGQFVRTQVGHVFYYNKRFTRGNGTYEFKAKGRWAFFWRGTTEDSTIGKALAIVSSGSILYYYECLWSGFVYGYHNNSRPREESVQVGQFLTDSLNQIRIVDVDSTAKIYVNNQLKLSLVISRDFRNTGYIEIGSNYQAEPTAFDDIIVKR